MARPTKYNKKIITDSLNYLKNYKKEHNDEIPSVVGLSAVLEITRETIYKWAKEEGKEAFSDILQKINATQQQVLINKGLSGDFNSNITKLVLGKHGFHDKQDKDITSQGDKIGFNITFQDGVSQEKDENSEN